MQNIHITRVEISELHDLQHIAQQTFSETFSSENDEANLLTYLEKSFSIEKLSSELANPDSQFYFARDKDEIIGYLKLNTGTAQTELPDLQALEIERIYVLAAYHGKKIGPLLMEHAIAVAAARHSSYVWLGVWEENRKAIRFYEKNGFTVFSQHTFKLGNEVQLDLLMKRALNY